MVNQPPMSGQLSDVARYARQDIMSLEPPQLENYRDAPIYDHTVILQLVAVRPIALWALEQHLGISSGPRGATEQNGQRRRYSERDLVALLWMRERVVAGEPPQEAGARLVASQRLRNSGGLNSSALRPNHPTAFPQGRFTSTTTGTLTFGEYPSGPLPPERAPGMTGGMGAATYTSGALPAPETPRGDYPSGSWTPTGQAPMPSLPQSRPFTPSRPLNPSRPLTNRVAHQTAPLPASVSGRLGAIYSTPTAITRPVSGFDPSRDQETAKDLRGYVSPLLQAFSCFDTQTANRLIHQALEQCSVEVVCLGVVQPAIARINDLWSRSELTIPEERFALSYLRGFLSSVFHSTMEPEQAPLVVVGCAQRDLNDLSPLLLAVFWRRSGMRVAYLGADAGALDLAQQRWAVAPAIICLTVSAAQRIRSLNQLAKALHALPNPRPELCYTGAVFARNLDLQRKVNATYLGDDPGTATTAVRRMLGIIF